MIPTIKEISESVAIVAQEYPIKHAELFGSFAKGNTHSESDVDLLVEFIEPSVSLIMLNSVKYRLEELLKRDVDIIHAPIPESSFIEIDRRISVYGA